ncbi:MAG: hypothetical protein WBM44_08880 [Waterburya sp.]
MFLTPSQIRCYLSIASTAVVLSLNTIIPASAEQVSFARESQRTPESSLEAESQERSVLSQVWREGKNLKIAEEYKLESKVSPSEPIDWSNTQVELDPNFQLDF